MKLAHKILVYLLLLGVIPSVMFSVFIYHYYANSIFARVQQERRVSVMQTASSVDLRLLAVENMARNLSYRTSLSKLLSGEDLAAHPIWHRKKFEESCSAMAHTLLYQDLGMEGISIFTSNRAIREKGGFYQADRLAGLAFYQAFMADEASFAIRCLDERETADYYAATERERFSDRAAALSLYKIYSLDGGVVGVLAFEFPAEELFSPVRLAVDNGNQYAVLFPGGRYYGVDPQATMETVPRDMIYAPLEHFPPVGGRRRYPQKIRLHQTGAVCVFAASGRDRLYAAAVRLYCQADRCAAERRPQRSGPHFAKRFPGAAQDPGA